MLTRMGGCGGFNNFYINLNMDGIKNNWKIFFSSFFLKNESPYERRFRLKSILITLFRFGTIFHE